MTDTISKLTLTAGNGILKNLIHTIVHSKDLDKFKVIFLANIIETKIIFTAKAKIKLVPSDWKKLSEFLDKHTEGLPFIKEFS